MSNMQLVNVELSARYEENAPGYQYDIFLLVKNGDRSDILRVQPTEPCYLSGDWIARERDGRTTGEWALYGVDDVDDACLASYGFEDEESLSNALLAFDEVKAAIAEAERLASEEED